MSINTPLQIFKPGTHTASNGITLEFSADDVAAIASNYNPAVHEAPLVIGHPQADNPAYGWVASLAFSDGILTASPTSVDVAFAELVNERKFSKISAAFYAPDSPSNPTPGSYYLRHVGFLGAQPPAVKGLKTPVFADDSDCLFFEETLTPLTTPQGNPEMTPEELAAQAEKLKIQQAELDAEKAKLTAEQTEFAEAQNALAAELKKAKQGKTETFIDELIAQGKILPKDKNGLLAYMTAETATDLLEFSEDGVIVKQGQGKWLETFLKALPAQVEFAEIAAAVSKATPADNQSIARRAQTYKKKMDAQGNNLSYAECVDAVNAGQDGVKP